MAKVSGKCTACGRSAGALSSCHGEKLCPSCSAVYSAINNRPQVVLAGLRKLKPEWLEELAGAPADVIRALDCPNDQWDLAAIQTAALLDETDRVLDETRRLGLRKNDTMREQWEDLAAIKHAIGIMPEATAEEVLVVIRKKIETMKRFRDLAEAAEQRADKLEDVITKCHAASGLVSGFPLDEWINFSIEENKALCRRIAEIESENRLPTGPLCQHGETLSVAIDPYREALADFGRAVIRGEATLIFPGR